MGGLTIMENAKVSMSKTLERKVTGRKIKRRKDKSEKAQRKGTSRNRRKNQESET